MKTEKIKTQTVYVEVPVSERLPESGKWVITNLGEIIYSHNYGWMKDSTEVFGNQSAVKWWLEKNEEMVCMSKEEFKQHIEKCFEAGYSRGMEVYSACNIGDDFDNTIPDKETYINNLFK